MIFRVVASPLLTALALSACIQHPVGAGHNEGVVEIGESNDMTCPGLRADALVFSKLKKIAIRNGLSGAELKILDAIECGNVSKISLLFESGISPNMKVGDRFPAFWAALSGSIPILEAIIVKGGSIDGEEGSISMSPLQGAMNFADGDDNWEVFDFLIAAGADPEIRAGNPPFTIVGHLVMIGQFGRVENLLDRGYDQDLCELRDLMILEKASTPEYNMSNWQKLNDKLEIILKDRNLNCG